MLTGAPTGPADGTGLAALEPVPRPPLARRLTGVPSSAIRDLLALTARPGVLSLAGGLPAPETLPREHLARLAAQVLASGPEALQYGPTEGLPSLRRRLADREAHLTGRPVDAEHVLVTSGSQQGLFLLGQALADPGTPIVVEDPGYLGGLQALAAAGAQLVPVRVDAGGLDVEVLADLLRAGLRPAAVYTVATFQNPSGGTAGPERRHALADLAEHYGFVLLDDDPYRDLWFAEPAPPPLTAFTDRAVHLASASKILAPGLRVGWLNAPEWLRGPLVRLKQAADLQAPSLGQALLDAALADGGWLERHVAAVRAGLAERATALANAVDRAFGPVVQSNRPRGGMFAWARFTDGTDAAELLVRALARGVAFVPGAEFATGAPDRSALRLAFATLGPADLAEAVDRLALAHADLAR